MSDVIHDPQTDWCACEPNGPDRCDYRLLADTVIEQLNPPDGDEAEVSLCISTIEQIAAYVRSLPCTCLPRTSDATEPCGRCFALGQWHGKVMER